MQYHVLRNDNDDRVVRCTSEKKEGRRSRQMGKELMNRLNLLPFNPLSSSSLNFQPPLDFTKWWDHVRWPLALSAIFAGAVWVKIFTFRYVTQRHAAMAPCLYKISWPLGCSAGHTLSFFLTFYPLSSSTLTTLSLTLSLFLTNYPPWDTP